MITFEIDPPLTDSALNDLFASAWPDHSPYNSKVVLARSLGYLGAYCDGQLIGFVNLATDWGEHAFLLDPMVDSAHRHKGIGLELIRRAADLARDRGCKWLHVDYEPVLAPFYHAAGFRDTLAGVMRLDHVG
jgi:GNAT superfamily N-acetyltransferase